MDPIDSYAKQYQDMLSSYLDEGGEDALHNAYELGRRALLAGLGLLDLINIHQKALLAVLEDNGKNWLKCVKAAGHFQDEAFSPYEISRLSSKDANNALRRLYDVLEEEAKRIAHILHDESAQILATAYLELADIERDSPPKIAKKVNLVVSHLDEVREQLRQLSHELRPLILDQLGLVPALRFLASGIKKRQGLDVTITGDNIERLSQCIETVLYRVVQEALNNVCRHAKATEAIVKVWTRDNLVHCHIKDDGIGFEAEKAWDGKFKGLGLVGIQERLDALDGNCEIISQPGNGVELHINIPI